MEHEPQVELPREPEALLIVVDTSTDDSQIHSVLVDTASRLSRTRLIYTVSKDDLIGVVKAGSSKTANKLAEQTEEGYPGIEVLHPPGTRSLSALKELRQIQPGGCPTNLLDILDVCGDCLSSTAAERCKKKRVVLFTDGLSIISDLQESDIVDFSQTCELFRKHRMQVDVVCYCPSEITQTYNQFEEQIDELEAIENVVREALQYEKGFLYVIAKLTGGIFLDCEEASSLVEMPTPKVKKATSKYSGVLNIADKLKIPVKRYSYVSKAMPANGKTISWKSSCQDEQPVPVLRETQRVASAKDGTALSPEEIVHAYPYGPELVPEQNEVDTYAWHMHLESCFDVIAFVDHDSIPQHLFLGSVDVVIPMPSALGASELLQPLVLSMQAEKLGLLARNVMNQRGGAPSLAYLWPRVEIDRETECVKNCFLFATSVPMKDDIRVMPFANLEDVLKDTSERATDAMDNFISSFMLNTSDKSDDDETDDEEEEFWPANICNPNIDWFNICIVHRALSGTSGTSLPRHSEWHNEILDPLNYLDESRRESFNEAITQLQGSLPVVRAPPKRGKASRVHQTRDGEVVSLGHYLPPEEIDDNMDHEIQSNGKIIAKPKPNDDFDEVMSTVTGENSEDIDVSTPVSDFWTLVDKGKFRFAALSLLVIIRRLIREVDDEKAMECIIALRKASADKKDGQFFNDFILNLLARCEKQNSIGNRTKAFLRHVGRNDKVSEALNFLPFLAKSDEESTEHKSRKAFFALHQKVLEKIASGSEEEKSVSNVTCS